MDFKRIAAVLLWLLVSQTSAFGFMASEPKTAPGDEVQPSTELRPGQHGGGQHEYAGPEAEWKGEERWVLSGNRAEQFFCGTLEGAGENGPSAREQCRING